MSAQSEPCWTEDELAQRQSERDASAAAAAWTLANPELMNAIQERMVELKEKYPRPI